MSQLKVNSIIPVGGIPTSGGNVYGGGIIQIVQADVKTQAAITATTYVDTGLQATITPTSSSSKILVIYDMQLRVFIQTTDNSAAIRVLRGSTPIESPSEGGSDYEIGYNPISVYNFASSTSYRASAHILDSPGTTSATTYKIQGQSRNSGTGNSVEFQDDNNYYSFLTLMEVSA